MTDQPKNAPPKKRQNTPDGPGFLAVVAIILLCFALLGASCGIVVCSFKATAGAFDRGERQ